MHSLVAYAAEEGAPNPLIPAWYDIIWSAVCFVIILIVVWKVAPKDDCARPPSTSTDQLPRSK